MDYLTLRRHVAELAKVLAEKPLVARAADGPGRSLSLRLKFKDHWADLSMGLDSPNQGVRLAGHCTEIEKNTSIIRVLNRLLTNGRLNAITLAGDENDNRFDRVVKLHFVVIDSFFGQRSDYYMFCEFTGRIADIFICDADLKILDRVSRTSNNLIGGSYCLPDSFPLLNPLTASLDDLTKAFAVPREEWKNRVGGISPQVEAELLFRFNAALAASDDVSLAQTFSQLFNECLAQDQARVYLKNGKLKAVSACELRHVADAPDQLLPDVNAAMNWIENELTAPHRINEIRKRVIAAFQRDLRQKTALLDDQRCLGEKYAHAEHYQNLGNLLVANLYRVKPGSRSIELEDWQTEENVVIELDPAKTPAANAQRFFNLYKKAKRGIVEVEKRIEALRGEIDWLREQIWLSENADEESDLQLEEKTKGKQKEGKKPRNEPANGRKGRQNNIKPSVEIDGCRYYVGRNAKQNDVLTFQVARRGDYWFHANDVPGAHVILKKPEGEINETDLWRGALLAAWFSFARASSKVAVDSTEISFVKKIPGGPPGRVTFSHQKTILVNPAEAETLINSTP